MIAMLFTLLAIAAVTPGQGLAPHTLPPPAPAPGLAYYVMAGNTIVSQPFKSSADCQQGLARLKAALAPNVIVLVCAHRAP
jgi:hypothetical protein